MTYIKNYYKRYYELVTTNKKIILLTEKIETEVFESWLGNFQAIKRMGMKIEIVYLKSNGFTEFVNTLVDL